LNTPGLLTKRKKERKKKKKNVPSFSLSNPLGIKGKEQNLIIFE